MNKIDGHQIDQTRKKKFQKFYIHFILTFTGNHVRKESSAGAK